MRSFVFAASFLASIGFGSIAHADPYQIDYTTKGGDWGSLLVMVTDTPVGGPFTITSITGVRDGLDVLGLSSYASSDQLLSPTEPYVDFSGVSFTTATGSYNLFNDGSYYGEIDSNIDSAGYSQSGVELTHLNVRDVPEPASVALLGVGLLGLAARRRAV